MKRRMLNALIPLLLFLPAVHTDAAWQFDNAADSVVFGDSDALTYPNDSFVVACWVRKDTAAAYGARIIESQSDSPHNFAITFNFDGASDTYVGVYALDGAAVEVDVWSEAVSTTSGVWYHIAVVRDNSSGLFRIYFNGEQVGASDFGSLGVINPSSLTVGNRGGGSQNRGFPGSIAECAKWDRLLSVEEIQSLATGVSPDCFSNSRVLYFPTRGTYQELSAGLVGTNNGAETTTHPRIISCGE